MESKDQFSYDSLANFLVKAKTETYASGDNSKIVKCEDGSYEVNYLEDNFRHRDRYYGEYNFGGEEVVWWNNEVVWTMNYFGIPSEREKIPDNFTLFLKEALRNVDAKYPFRGPENYKNNDLEYINNINGDLKDFSGVEIIRYKAKEIYKLYYHGGTLLT